MNGYSLNFKISNNGKHIAYIIDNYRREKQKMYIDGKLIGEIDEPEDYAFFFSKDGEHTVCYSFRTNVLYFDGKKIEGNIHLLDYAFEDYGILSYDKKSDNKTVYHLLIDGKNYKGRSLPDCFIYLEGNDIIYIKK